MNRKLLTIVAVASLVLPNGIAAADSLNAKPGLWSITENYVRSPGHTMPNFRDPQKRCLSAQDMASPEKALGSGIVMMNFDGPPTDPDAPKETCNRTAFQETANTVSFKYECSGQFAMTKQGTINFDSPTHFVAMYNVEVERGSRFQPMLPNMKSEGTWVGECATDAHR